MSKTSQGVVLLLGLMIPAKKHIPTPMPATPPPINAPVSIPAIA
nr:hypothetical protein [Candidatus Sigynarchaeota archaeon]